MIKALGLHLCHSWHGTLCGGMFTPHEEDEDLNYSYHYSLLVARNEICGWMESLYLIIQKFVAYTVLTKFDESIEFGVEVKSAKTCLNVSGV